MTKGPSEKSWALTISTEYRKDFNRLLPKYRSQVSRKTQDLMHDPTPGGSRTPLTQYDGLCRLRAGEFRIIYGYNESVVKLLSLRRRDESTYEDLDHMEIQQFEEFRYLTGPNAGQHRIPEWEELAKKWAAPVPQEREVLPRPITPEILSELRVPEEYQTILLGLESVDDLLYCESVPANARELVLEYLFPRSSESKAEDPLPIVVRADLVDDKAANVSGPIDTGSSADGVEGAAGLSMVPTLRNVPAPLFLVSARRQSVMEPYVWNASRAVGKDARYTVKLDGTVQLTYSLSTDEYALLTTDEHGDLVALVNEAKRKSGSALGGGGFLINEFRHVLVPTQDRHVLYAGDYTRDLEFTFEGSLVSPVARSGILPGDIWPGPHVGVKYVLAAGATDIRCDIETGRGTIKTFRLSAFHSREELAGLLAMCRYVKPGGGAIYINEARELFAPVDQSDGYNRIYIGHLGTRPWFPNPV